MYIYHICTYGTLPAATSRMRNSLLTTLLAAAGRVKTLSPKCLETNHTHAQTFTRVRDVYTHSHAHTHTHVQRHVQLDTVVYTFAAHLIAALGQLACGCLAWRLCLQIFAQMFANLTQVALPPSPSSVLVASLGNWQKQFVDSSLPHIIKTKPANKVATCHSQRVLPAHCHTDARRMSINKWVGIVAAKGNARSRG